ncbi:DUF418 domain-containing protein [Flavivirga eckloniae]|uniref:DUF418 domain-containing protein n=1 Tax=Flavivirga eckloniae TaxID=1803846 RepID=A0A2K9PKG3_9FLAO|nr:DUF418 domain-containing protein [Flavivirga eckloniae]AUP77540.1 hypothetical protein C1H87_01915 [Flavivirga eckloniae]
MKNRIIGIDVARSLAVIGMIIVHFKIVFGDQGNAWIKAFANFFDGKAAATFVVLAGVGLALMTNSSVKTQNLEKLRLIRIRIIKRAIFLFLIGLSYLWIWPADILHSYGVYLLLTLFFINKKATPILIAVIAIIAIFPLLLLIWDYDNGWDFTTLYYDNFWTVKGFLRNLFYNGYNPVFPWVAFMLFGLWYGRQNLNDEKFVKKSFWIGLSAFIFIQLFSNGMVQYLSNSNNIAFEEINSIFGTEPMPPLPIFMMNGLSIAVTTISGCILMCRNTSNIIIDGLYKTGRLALTFYVAHVVIGIGFMEELGSENFGNYSIEFSVLYAFAFSFFCACFAWVWFKYKDAGPLEWVMRKLTD